MKKKIKNPFEVFGLSPKIVKELDEEALYRLIKAIYKVFQMTYHPDKGGDPEKALEINLAFEMLNLEKNPDSFREYRKKYIKRLSRKTLQKEIEELRAQNRKLIFCNELLKEKIWRFLENGSNFMQNLFKNGNGLNLKIFDIVSYINFSNFGRTKKQMFFKEIIISKNFVLKRNAYEKIFRKIPNYKCIGSIKREYLEPWTLLGREFRDDVYGLKNFMDKSVFIKECLLYLDPEIKNNSYVFFYTPECFEKVFLEGVVIKIEEIKDTEIKNILETKTLKIDKTSENINTLNTEIAEF